MKYFFVALSSVLALQIVVGVPSNPLQKIVRESHQTFAEHLSLSAVINAPDENVIVSPLLIEEQLALIYAGSVSGTEALLRNALHLERLANKSVALSNLEVFFNNASSQIGEGVETGSQVVVLENAAYKWKPEFQQEGLRLNISSSFNIFTEPKLIEANYDLLLRTKFQSGPTLPNSLLNSTDQFVLASALVLNAPWRTAFPVKNFRQIEFGSRKDNQTSVVGMSVTEILPYANLQELDAVAVEVPYNSSMSMLIVLPNKRDGLSKLEQNLQLGDLAIISKQLKPRKIDLVLPKFKIEYHQDLKDTLTYMGYDHIFTKHAKFSDIVEFTTDLETLPVTHVPHNVVLNVDFEGGSPHSGFFESITNMLMLSTDVVVDHPFYFVIRTTDHIVLTGHIINVQ